MRAGGTTVTAGTQQTPDDAGSVEARGRFSLKGYLTALGPGMISGASDNDPTTVATMSVVGAATVYRLSWLVVLIYPMLAAIQMISAKLGVVTKRGLQRDIVKQYGRGWGMVLLISVLAVNIVTIAADLEGGAAAIGLITGAPWQWFVLPFAIMAHLVLTFGSYNAVQKVLRWVLFVFLAYVASAFAAHPNWGSVLQATIRPSLAFNQATIQGALALLGTTLTSYAYVWESIEEAEERPPISTFGLAQADAGIGMLFAVAVFWFILIGTGATLGVAHKPVQTAQDAAQALAPVAGPIASYLFAAGLLASALLAVPVLAATSAYVVGQEIGVRSSLSAGVWRARPFYLALGGALLLGVVIAYAGISPIRLLFASSIAGGLGTPISMAFLLLAARNRDLMGEHVIRRPLQLAGWATWTVITVVSLIFFGQLVGG